MANKEKPQDCYRYPNPNPPARLKREWEKRGYPATGPTFPITPLDTDKLYKELFEYLDIPEQKGADEKDNEDGIK